MDGKKCNNLSHYSPFMIWRNYVIGILPLALVPVFIFGLPFGVCQFLTLAMTFGLFAFVRCNRVSRSETCMLIPFTSARALLALTVVYVVIDFAFHDLPEGTIKPYKALIVSVVTFLVVLGTEWRGGRNSLCIDCMMRNGSPFERRILGHIYSSENHYLVPRLLLIVGLVVALGWGYWYFGYKQVYYEWSDSLVFYLLPLIVFVFDACILGYRYYLLYTFGHERATVLAEGTKSLRVILICGNRVCYTAGKDGLLDTPFTLEDSFSEVLSAGVVRSFMTKNVGASTMKFCYGTIDIRSRKAVEHYFCFVDSEDVAERFAADEGIELQWMDKDEIAANFRFEKFSPFAAAEISRVFNIMVTSKIFDLSGRRKIKLRGYVPPFSIDEIRNSDVDFSDNRWMILSRFNKSSSFYWVRLLWYKYIEGLG
ncbi:MAG: hypothetical protein PUB61_04205 [Bacteroidales bacterium]|nr:hypothetical protein [Bacteroidales bacterium]